MRILLEIIGWAGVAAVVGAYGLATSRVLPTDSRGSAWLNMLGAAALMVDCAASQTWPSATLNLVWLLIALLSLIRYWQHGRRTALSIPGSPHPTERGRRR